MLHYAIEVMQNVCSGGSLLSEKTCNEFGNYEQIRGRGVLVFVR
jgi:hypothetical protein